MLKRSETSNHEKIWRNLKCALPSEKSQSEMVTYCLNPNTCHSGKDTLQRQ